MPEGKKMRKKDFIEHLAEISGQTKEAVAEVMFHLPDALLMLQAGDSLSTRMGVWRTVIHKGKTVTPPKGGTKIQTSPTLIVKLRPGIRLRRPVQENKSESPE